MDNGQNKLIVMIAVGIVGAVAGQHFLKPTAPPVQQAGPWGPGYQYPPQVMYAPAYGPTPYPVPQGAMPAVAPQPVPQTALEPGLVPSYSAPSHATTLPRRNAGRVRLAQHVPEALDESLDIEPAEVPATPTPTRVAALPTPASLAPVIVSGLPSTMSAPIIKTIKSGTLIWTSPQIAALYLRDSTPKTTVRFPLTVPLNQDADVVYSLTPSSQTIPEVPVFLKKLDSGTIRPESADFPIDLPELKVAPGEYRLMVGIRLTGTTDSPLYSQPVTIKIPSGGAAPNSVATSSTLYSPIVPVASDPKSRNVFSGYLKVVGKATPGTRIRFLLATAPDANNVDTVVRANFDETLSNGSEDWEKELSIPSLASGVSDGHLYILADTENGHTYLETPISIRQSVRATAPKVQIDAVRQTASGGMPARPTVEWFLNQKDLTIDVKTEGTVTDGILTVMAAGSSIPLKSVAYTAGSNAIPWTATRDGDVTLQVQVLQGNSLLQSSEPLKISVRTTGPRPTGVTPTNLSQTPGQSVIRVAFNPENPLNSRSVAGGGFVLTNLADGGTNFTAKAANYSATDNVVDAVFPAIAEGAYELSVTGITDVYGNALAKSADNKPITFGIIKPVGSDAPSTPVTGLTNLTGPNVTYQEYTEPRTLPTGFNPSDKVVTRVARLYYYRDAHRVVQLINRGARSFNRQGVDVQQQLADNARTQAENATGVRRAAEQKAIQAAQRARAAETALNQFQQALVQARQQQTAADAALQQHQKNQSTLQNDLDDSTARRSALEQADTSMMSSTEKANQATAIKNEKQTETTLRRKVDAGAQETTKRQSDLTAAKDQVRNLEGHVTALLGEIQNARNDEAEQRQTLDQRQFEEDTKVKDLFRREVAAAHADPDTYAPGKPDSLDPIEQVSLSVIGEGLIQLRGPLKGVNLARTLINQIDAPVGQVKVAIHTVQVNGEHAKRMEPVIGRIQRYIDHSRFLTTQSSQMLRNAVTLVASRRADQAMLLCETNSQVERDQKYIEAFFGREFLAELRTLDSEFLHTGNKLLSLHSMDSTSLANALFLLSLAKNDVRQEILAEFERMVTCQLPEDEMEYFTASNEKYKFGPIFHKQKFVFLGHNAKFVSLRGFFNAEQVGSDTITPMQREFIRLAQIFKSRLVTEIELQQRVMERALIEDRFEDYAGQVRAAQADEAEAELKQKASHDAFQVAQLGIVATLNSLAADIRREVSVITTTLDAAQSKALKVSKTDNDKEDIITMLAKDYGRLQECIVDAKKKKINLAKKGLDQPWMLYGFVGAAPYPDTWYRPVVKGEDILISTSNNAFHGFEAKNDEAQARVIHQIVIANWEAQVQRLRILEKYRYFGAVARAFEEARDLLSDKTMTEMLNDIRQNVAKSIASNQPVEPFDYKLVLTIHEAKTRLDIVQRDFASAASMIEAAAREMALFLDGSRPNITAAIQKWNWLSDRIAGSVIAPDVTERFQKHKAKIDASFAKLIETKIASDLADQSKEAKRRPLDHKKFLDMLIDDVEDKFIELMEGTRAHTANIDNYLSRLGQALEDDFNTQFYFPAFKGIREASRFWDVNLGQIETTTILTNNRMLAKVSPQATMEFDLPKRDILIQEAFQSAQAAYDDYGALLGDPTFLALTKMYRGQPTSAMFGSEALTPVTRNVLPGLPSSTDERLVAQNRAVAPDFPSALESLIPDPAIYKFETGTGYEIRPVIQPDGQAVVFHFNYMYTTNVREPVRADEKHLGRVKRHFIDTDVQTGNYEMREVSKYQVALKASRTSRGVPLLEDIPGAGILFRPLPSQESSIQENIILAQSVIFPTLFDLMGLRWAPAVADLDSLRLQEADFVTRSRQRGLRERVFDYSSQQVDDFLRIPQSERRPDVYRSQETTPYVHPNGYAGPGLGLKDGVLREGYAPEMTRPQSRYAPGANPEGAIPGSMRGGMLQEGILLPPPGAIDPHRGHLEGPASGPRPISTESRPNGPVYPGANGPSRPSGSDVPMGPADHPPLNGTPMSPSGEARLNERAVPSPRTGSRLRPPAAQTRTTPDERSPVQLQSYTTESPAATKPIGPASAPKGSRPVPSPAGSPPRLLPQGLPTPQRVPAGAGSQKPEAGKAVPLTSQTGFSPAPARPQIQSSGDIKPKGTTPTAPIVQVSGSDASNLESKSAAKKKTSLWPRKP